MGASKKIMEEMIMSYSSKFPITTARFANVAFSNGSLPLGFLDRISKLQPISAPSDVTRYFVSPQESGEICMLACILGNSSEIFFLILQQKQVMTFSSIAISLLKEFGYEIIACSSENEALLEAEKLKKGDNKYPVYFSLSDTTGEKPYEEFYTQSEIVDLTRFSSLGVVTNITPKSIHEIEQFLDELSLILNNSETSKIEIVNTIKKFIPNFLHEEKGKFLDDKM
jgi:FlaA1/EpsC-like NDP-sugar epimerase